MATWYLGKIKFQREDEAGTLKTFNESYLVDAISYSEAEARVYDVTTKNNPDFTLERISKMRLNEVFYEENDCEKWFKAKVQYSTLDEKSLKEKKINHFVLINGENPKNVYELLHIKLGSLLDYEITDINLTSILEVHPHIPENDLLKNGNFKSITDIKN